VIQIVCPCGSQTNFAVCCEPLLTRKVQAQTPEALMRSRYSAFCEGNIDYLVRTHHPSQRSADDRDRLAQSIQEIEWVGLRVVKSEADEDCGMVEFVAFYRERQFSTLAKFKVQASSKPPEQRHERSTFMREAGHWLYVDGITLPPIIIARNDPCWCSSGRKFKQCHGRR